MMTKGHVEFTVVQLRQWGDGQVVIKGAANVVKPDARVHDGRRVVGSSGLDDEDLRAGGGQFSRQSKGRLSRDTTSRSERAS